MAARTTTYSASLQLAATAERIWLLVADPAQHHRFDSTGMVGAAVGEAPRQPGDIFTMQMAYDDGSTVERYKTDNQVTVLRPPQCIEWTVAPHGGRPLGWRWRYELVPTAAGGTTVTLTYDWTGTSTENIARFGVPLVDAAGLAASLDRLATAVR